jgi:hypothetical protein
MKFRLCRNILIASVLTLACPAISPVHAQSTTGTLRGQVTDPSGSAVPAATVLVTTPKGDAITAETNRDGNYEVKGLAPGQYSLKIIAQGFAPFEHGNIEIPAGQTQKQDVRLTIEVQQEEVLVSDQPAAALDVNPSSNAGAIVLQGKDLEALSDDPDELQSDLQALAGPSAGPNGGQIYIDGFTGGQLPPKASIREIRINQNPFSAEYDKLGYGRIEIFTKPGTDQFHGELFVSGNSSSFNSQSPFVKTQPSYESTRFGGNVGGPLSKKASFFLDFQRRNINDLAVVNAEVLDPSLQPIAFSSAIPNPRTRTNITPRLDYQLGANNTLTFRYQLTRDSNTNAGIGQFSLPSTGFNSEESEHTFQVSDTQTFGAKVVNETRFQYIRDSNSQIAQSTATTISVPGAFTSGGNSQGTILDTQDHYEFQNYTSMVMGKHLLKFGARLRAIRDASNSSSNFNGTFTFRHLSTYQRAQELLQQGVSPAQVAAMGFGPEQFTITTGFPRTDVAVFDAGLYVQDDWRLRPNMTLSYGFRFETQNQINDHADIAPRLGFAWGLGTGGKNKSPRTVLRAGFGMFYNRFTSELVLQAERVNGLVQQQFIVQKPDFFPNVPVPCTPNQPNVPAGCNLNVPPMAVSRYQIDPSFRAPYTIQTGVSIERQLTNIANIAVTYLTSRGVHQLLLNNINTPFPGTFNPADPLSGTRPFGNVGNIFQYQSNGIFKQNQLIVNGNVRAGAKLTVIGYYVYNHANTNAAEIGTSSGNSTPGFTSSPYNLSQDFGRAPFDIRHRLFVGGTIGLPHAFLVSPFLVFNSGPPFNITVPNDLNGSTILNQRPSFASSLSNPKNVIGPYNTVPVPGETIVPFDYGVTPARFTLNVRLSKTFGFGRKSEGNTGKGPTPAGGTFGRGPGRGGPGRDMDSSRGNTGRRYNLTLSVSARNVFNNVNLAAPSGVLGSRFFGVPNALAGGPFSSASANRRIDLTAVFNF